MSRILCAENSKNVRMMVVFDWKKKQKNYKKKLFSPKNLPPHTVSVRDVQIVADALNPSAALFRPIVDALPVENLLVRARPAHVGAVDKVFVHQVHPSLATG